MPNNNIMKDGGGEKWKHRVVSFLHYLKVDC